MRGSAQLVSDRSSPAALRAAWQGLSSPVHPGQEGRRPSLDHPGQNSPVPTPQAKGYAPLEPALREPCSPRPQRGTGELSPFRPSPNRWRAS